MVIDGVSALTLKCSETINVEKYCPQLVTMHQQLQDMRPRYFYRKEIILLHGRARLRVSKTAVQKLQVMRPKYFYKKEILLLHDSARLRVSRTAVQKLHSLHFEILPHPPHFPDLPYPTNTFFGIWICFSFFAGKTLTHETASKPPFRSFFDPERPTSI